MQQIVQITKRYETQQTYKIEHKVKNVNTRNNCLDMIYSCPKCWFGLLPMHFILDWKNFSWMSADSSSLSFGLYDPIFSCLWRLFSTFSSGLVPHRWNKVVFFRLKFPCCHTKYPDWRCNATGRLHGHISFVAPSGWNLSVSCSQHSRRKPLQWYVRKEGQCKLCIHLQFQTHLLPFCLTPSLAVVC